MAYTRGGGYVFLTRSGEREIAISACYMLVDYVLNYLKLLVLLPLFPFI